MTTETKHVDWLTTETKHVDWLNAIDGLTVKDAIVYLQKLDPALTLKTSITGEEPYVETTSYLTWQREMTEQERLAWQEKCKLASNRRWTDGAAYDKKRAAYCWDDSSFAAQFHKKAAECLEKIK